MEQDEFVDLLARYEQAIVQREAATTQAQALHNELCATCVTPELDYDETITPGAVFGKDAYAKMRSMFEAFFSGKTALLRSDLLFLQRVNLLGPDFKIPDVGTIDSAVMVVPAMSQAEQAEFRQWKQNKATAQARTGEQ